MKGRFDTGFDSGIEFLIAVLTSDEYDIKQIDRQVLPSRAVRLFEFIFNLIQKTVDQKINYSVVIGLEACSLLEKDEFYTTNTKPHLPGLRISQQDLAFMISTYTSCISHFISAPASVSSTDILHNSHAILKVFIAITYLGAYNKLVQDLFYPTALDLTVRLLDTLNKKYYREKIQVN